MGWYILGLIIALIIQACIAVKFSSLAEEKGYNGTSYFWLCFLLGTIGYCMVAALPDLSLHHKINKIMQNDTPPTASATSKPVTFSSSSNAPACTPATITKSGTWICGNCKTENSMNYGQCKKCGKFRSN